MLPLFCLILNAGHLRSGYASSFWIYITKTGLTRERFQGMSLDDFLPNKKAY